MSIISHDELKNSIDDITFVFKTASSIREHLEVIFVFGSNDFFNSNRTKFLNYVSSKKTPFKFITIEALYNDLQKYSSGKKGVTAKRIALVELELRAIKQAYSLIIFPESVGSYAELGYFAALEETKQKICVVNHYQFSSHESYLNHLVDVIHNERKIRPVQLDFNSAVVPATDFDSLISNLVSDYEDNKHTKRFTHSPLFPLAITYEIVKILPFLTFTQLRTATEAILRNFKGNVYDPKDFTVNISMLVVSELIIRKEVAEQIYFLPVESSYDFIDFSLSERDRVHLMALMVEYSEHKKRVSS